MFGNLECGSVFSAALVSPFLSFPLASKRNRAKPKRQSKTLPHSKVPNRERNNSPRSERLCCSAANLECFPSVRFFLAAVISGSERFVARVPGGLPQRHPRAGRGHSRTRQADAGVPCESCLTNACRAGCGGRFPATMFIRFLRWAGQARRMASCSS